MPKKDGYITPPRLSIDLTEEERLRLNRCIPWGLQRKIFSVMIDSLCSSIEKHGEFALAAIMTRKMSVLDIIPPKEEKK